MTVGGRTGRRLIGCVTALAVLVTMGCGGASDDGARVDELREEIRQANEQLDEMEGTKPEPAEESAATTEVPVVDAAAWDYANDTLPPEVCERFHGTSSGVTLSDGSARLDGAGPILVDLMAVETGDLTGDGEDEAVVVISCSAGAEPSVTGEVAVFESAPGSPRLLAHLPEPVTTIETGIKEAQIESADGDLTVVWGLRGSFMHMGFLPNLLTERLRWDGAQFVVEESSTTPAVDFDQLGSIEEGDLLTWEGYLCSTFEDFRVTAGWPAGAEDLYLHARLVGDEITLLVTDFFETESSWIMTRDGYELTDPDAWQDEDVVGEAWTEEEMSTCTTTIA